MTPDAAAAIRALAEELRGASTTAHRAFQAARDGDTAGAMDAADAAATATTEVANALDRLTQGATS